MKYFAVACSDNATNECNVSYFEETVSCCMLHDDDFMMTKSHERHTEIWETMSLLTEYDKQNIKLVSLKCCSFFGEPTRILLYNRMGLLSKWFVGFGMKVFVVDAILFFLFHKNFILLILLKRSSFSWQIPSTRLFPGQNMTKTGKLLISHRHAVVMQVTGHSKCWENFVGTCREQND